jgi:hypothetical protein
MGTRSTIKFYSEWDDKAVLLSVYQQYDGYIRGVGHDLARWLSHKKILNGYRMQTIEEGYANGMGCLAAQYVATMKFSIGNFYLTIPTDRQEYNYQVRYADGQFNIKVKRWDSNRAIFDGTPQELLEFEEKE